MYRGEARSPGARSARAPARSLEVCLLGLLLGAALAACAPGRGAAGGEAAQQAGSAAASSPASAVADAPSSQDVPGAEAFRDAIAAAPARYLEQARYAQADVERGELLSLACKACHALDVGEHNDHAPSLRGVIGRRAASLPDFDYSDALRASGIVWTPAAIEAWLAEPDAFVPGTKMKFTGFRSAEDRRDLVAYLLRHVGGAGPDEAHSP